MRRLRLILQRSAVALAGIVIVAGLVIVMFSHTLLTVDDGDVKADALVVLGGGLHERPERAAALFNAGVAPKVVVSGTGDCETNVRILEQNGVPASAITTEDRSSSTLENAKFSVPLLRHMGAHRVIVVTSWYHSRRALSCFRHFAPDMVFYSRPSYEGYPRRDWPRQGIGGYILSEYIKTAGYWVVHGVSPF